MNAAVCHEVGKPLVVEELDLDAPRRGEVKVRIAATAVCYSDISIVRGHRGTAQGPIATPFVPGHESAGYVEAVGDGVTAVQPGDAVVVSLLVSCGGCAQCSTGRPHVCEADWPLAKESRLRNRHGQRVTAQVKVGAFAEYVIVDQSQLAKVPNDMPMAEASLLACGVITGFGAVVNRAQVRPMSSVVVIGAGGVGLNSVQGAACCGAWPIIAVDMLDSKLAASTKFGATHTVNAAKGDAIQAVKELTGGRGADYVFVTVGNSAAIKQGFQMSATRGMTVIVGLPPSAESFSLVGLDFVRSERMLTGSFMGTTNLKMEIPKLVTLYQEKRLKLTELITGRYPLAQINEAMESVERGDALRNVIVF